MCKVEAACVRKACHWGVEEASNNGHTPCVWWVVVPVQVACCLHWASCLYHFLAAMSDYAEDSWVARSGIEDENNVFRCVHACMRMPVLTQMSSESEQGSKATCKRAGLRCRCRLPQAGRVSALAGRPLLLRPALLTLRPP